VAASGSPAKRRRARPERVRERAVDAVAAWVSYQLIGGTQAAERHDIARRTLYRRLDEVEADPALLAAARARLAEQKANGSERLAEVNDAAIEALLGRIRSGRLHPRHLVAIATATAAVRSPSQGRGGSALEVPSILATPREAGAEDDAAETPPDPAPEVDE